MRQIALSALLVLAAATPALAQPRAVIELFTSQGCSSCPPADRMMNGWADQNDVVALTMPVDYWDYLGWKDTLASHDFTMRQRAYSEVRGDRNVYTPQVIVDGLIHAVGSNGTDVAAAIKEGHDKANVLSVPVTIGGGPGAYTVTIAAGGPKAKVLLVPISRQVKVAIGRGENNGTTVTYSNVARTMRPVGDYDGTAMTLTLDAKAVAAPGADSFAVLVQEMAGDRPGAIFGAALQRP